MRQGTRERSCAAGLRPALRPALQLRLGTLALVAAALAPAAASARVLLDREQALRAAFGEAEVARRPVFLDEAELARLGELAGSEPATRAPVVYEARREGALLGRAYFDQHLVRTLPELLMIVVGPAGQVERVEVLVFREPPDYLPPGRWFAQFEGKRLDPELRLKRKIQAIAGATLSSRAATAAVRRALALDALLREREAAAAPVVETSETQQTPETPSSP